jgi:DNA-binding MarR family transcriptional regulator
MPAAVRASAGFLVKQVADLFRQRFEGVLATQCLHPRQYLLLAVLRDEGTMPQHALGARVGMDRTTTMQAVQRLADAGLVLRSDDPADRRVYRLALSKEGRRVLQMLEEKLQRVETELLSPLALSERRVFLAQLQAIVGSVDEG